jgi:hypothetical protein
LFEGNGEGRGGEGRGGDGRADLSLELDFSRENEGFRVCRIRI